MTLTSGHIPTVPATQTQKRDPQVILKDIAKVQQEIKDYGLQIARASGNKGRAVQHMSKVDRLGADGLDPSVKRAKERLKQLNDEHDEAMAALYSVN